MSTQDSPTVIHSEDAVYNRYAAAAHAREEALCCPVEYAADFLAVIPEEIIERDYGCGDPTRYALEARRYSILARAAENCATSWARWWANAAG